MFDFKCFTSFAISLHLSGFPAFIGAFLWTIELVLRPRDAEQREKSARIMVAPLFAVERPCFSSRRGFPGVDYHSARDKGLRCPGRDGGRDHEPPEGEKPRKKASTSERAFLRGFLTGGGEGGVAAGTPGPCAPRGVPLLD